MKVLSRYLVRQNLFLLFIILLTGTGLYLLTDLFERLDNFLDAGLGIGMVLSYLLVKIPLIISQILPAVFFLSLVLQLNFLERSRELMALNAGGVSPFVILRFILVYSLIWAGGQLLFSQVIGVAGEQQAQRMWEEDVKGRSREDATLKGLWFTEGNIIAHIGLSYPAQGRGENIQAYKLDAAGLSITEIIRAATFSIVDGKWILSDGEILTPASYSGMPFATYELPIHQDLRTFQLGGARLKRVAQLSLLELSDNIERLQLAGSNVESLRTVWHGKMAYAASLIVLGMLALVVSNVTGNIYKAVALSLVIAFLYFSLNTLGLSMGEKGILPPAVAAWLANIFFSCAGLLRLFLPGLRRWLKNLGKPA